MFTCAQSCPVKRNNYHVQLGKKGNACLLTRAERCDSTKVLDNAVHLFTQKGVWWR
jgi:hypothetical protein